MFIASSLLMILFDCYSSAKVSHCGTYLFAFPREGCRDNLVYFAPLPDTLTSRLELTCVVDKFEFDYEVRTDLLKGISF